MTSPWDGTSPNLWIYYGMSIFRSRRALLSRDTQNNGNAVTPNSDCTEHSTSYNKHVRDTVAIRSRIAVAGETMTDATSAELSIT